jgi:hypothetical protein
MPLAGFESTIPAIKRPQTLTLDLSATAIGSGFIDLIVDISLFLYI